MEYVPVESNVAIVCAMWCAYFSVYEKLSLDDRTAFLHAMTILQNPPMSVMTPE